MDTQIERIYTKNGRVAQQIAVQLLRLKKGEQLPRIDDFVRVFNAARGTIQGGLRLLEEMSAVRLESRGHLGTFLVDKDQSLLWKIADRGALVAAMPLPYSRRYEGLATGFVQIFEEMKLPFTIAYMRGADSRIEALRSRRIDFAIVSRWAAEKACRQYNDLSLQQFLGEKTYVEHHGVLFADRNKKQIEPGMRVGIDPSSRISGTSPMRNARDWMSNWWRSTICNCSTSWKADRLMRPSGIWMKRQTDLIGEKAGFKKKMPKI